MNAIDEEAAVRASLDAALGELLRAAVENPREPYAANCIRINAAFDSRMASHRYLGCALAEAEALERRFMAGLHEYAPDAASPTHGAGCEDMGEAHL